MEKIPFNTYDFFGYLAAGSVVVCTVDYGYGDRFILGGRPATTFVYFLAILVSYITGQVVSQIAGWIIERGFARRLLGTPFRLLMSDVRHRGIGPFFFPGYFEILPKTVRDKAADRREKNGLKQPNEGFFAHVYEEISGVDRKARRLDSFRDQYGFARNVTFSLFFAAIALGIAMWMKKPVNPWIPSGAAVLAVGMFYRFLKFYRLFSVELLRAYAEGVESKDKQ